MEISITSLNFLVALMEIFELEEKTQEELLSLYYKSLEMWGNDKIEIKNRPNLLKFLENNSCFENICGCYFYVRVMPKNNTNIFIGCSSRNDIPKQYLDDCNTYLEGLFNYETNLVFGASNDGLMGISYNIAKDKKRDIIGICPYAYQEDLKKLNCNKQIITKTVQERTSKLFELSDALVFLPGGIGTIYEFFASLEYMRTKEIEKPIILYNSCGYYDTMFKFLDEISQLNFVSLEDNRIYHISNSADDTIDYINEYYRGKNKVKIKK